MNSIHIDIVNDRAMALIRYLESVGDIRLNVQQRTAENDGSEKQPNSDKEIVQRDWYGILADHPDKAATLHYFDTIRDEWDDRY